MVGKIKRIPLELLEEMDKIKEQAGVWKDRDAFMKMREYSKVGREVERMKPFNFLRKKPKQPPYTQ